MLKAVLTTAAVAWSLSAAYADCSAAHTTAQAEKAKPTVVASASEPAAAAPAPEAEDKPILPETVGKAD